MTQTIELPKRLGLQTVPELVEQIKEHRGSDLVLDASGVSTLGALGLQALLCVSRAWADDGQKLEIKEMSGPMKAQLANFGLQPSALVQGD